MPTETSTPTAAAAPQGDGVGTSAALMRAALAGTGTAVWHWDLDSGRVGDIDQGLALLGYTAGDLGDTQAEWNRLIHPADVLAVEAAYQRHLRGESAIYEHVYRARHKSGEWRWLLERGRIVERHPDGRPRRMVGTHTDITERRAIEAAASEATLRLQRVARQAPGVLFQYELAPDGRACFRYLSERLLEVFGIEPEEALADSTILFRTVDGPARESVAESIRDSARDLSGWRREFPIRRPDGERRWVFGVAAPERQIDGRTVWHGYIEDVTERRELEAARAEAEVAAAANRAKTLFLGRMSHELRTPLNAVLGFAQLMEIDRNEPPSAGQLRRLKLIREAGEHLLHMISDMLDLTRIESGSMTLQPEPLDLHALAAQALEMVAETAAKAQVTLALAGTRPAPPLAGTGPAPPLAGTGPAPPLAAVADRTRLRQVLFNLLVNAIKYNRPGGRVELTVARDPADPSRALIAVRDDGVGIAEADLPHVFEPFHRGAQSNGPVEGAGIGLAVTQAIVQLMGGHIEAESRPGAGSTFTVRVPLGAP